MEEVILGLQDYIKVIDDCVLNIDNLNIFILQEIKIKEELDIILKWLNINQFEEIGCLETVKIEKFISINVNFIPEILIDIEFNLTPKELIFMESLTVNKIEQRHRIVARNYFILKRTITEIAAGLQLSTTQISRDLANIKLDLIKSVKKDLRANKKLLGHMVGMMYELIHQSRVMWSKHDELDADVRDFRAMMVEARQNMQTNPERFNSSLSRVLEIEKTILQIHDRMQSYQSLLRQTSRQLLELWEKFGLCGDEAIKVIFSGGVDVDAKIIEIKQMMLTMASIVKSEIKEENKRQRIFSKFAREIKPDGIGRFTKQDSLQITSG